MIERKQSRSPGGGRFWKKKEGGKNCKRGRRDPVQGFQTPPKVDFDYRPIRKILGDHATTKERELKNARTSVALSETRKTNEGKNTKAENLK